MNSPYQLAVIGAGSGGREAAMVAAHNGLRVILIEREALGGTCLHHGFYCLKALRACVEAGKYNRRMPDPKPGAGDVASSLPDWVTTQRKIAGRLTQAWNNQLDRAGVKIEFGQATLAGSNKICLASSHGKSALIEADYIILATGSRPEYDAHGPNSRFVNSIDLLQRKGQPSHLLVVGGGYIGCEFASIFRAIGSKVTVVEKRGRLLCDWDEAVGDFVAKSMLSSGVELHLGCEFDVVRYGENPEELTLGDGTRLSSDLVLVATGRRPNVEDLKLETMGIEANPFIQVDEQMRTSCERVFAVGDVNGQSLLDSAAISQARVAVDAILGKPTRFSSRWIPRCIHTQPGAASIGWNEDEAGKAGLDVIAHSQTFRLVTDDDRTILNPAETMLKVLIRAESREILGVHAVGHQAAEIVNFVSVAIRSGLTLEEVL
ncbi:MAG TPA: NAD(P)/FAD-dependent oxidoreductase, partial [Chthoniobacterales bacterium]|nr:NAD(P)/FAD-dependent oxidoreductase [Chthoniobacterales bacterium]